MKRRAAFFLLVALLIAIFAAIGLREDAPTPPTTPAAPSVPAPLPSPSPAAIRPLAAPPPAAVLKEPEPKPPAARPKASRKPARVKRARTEAPPKPRKRRTRTARKPAPDAAAEPEIIPDVPKTAEARARAEGRRKRAGFPVGVILRDNVAAMADPGGRQAAYRFMTGDFVRVLGEDATGRRVKVHPGLDVFLAATSRNVKPTGERLPDQPGWVDKESVYAFEPAQEKEFLETVEPVTLGSDPNFSTLGFYERAMKNPDPVVHRVMAPRLMAILEVHEDYSKSWGSLYRDRDPKIRSLALKALRQRGVANSRPLLEDLIVRVQELTRAPARGVAEAEVLAVLGILRNSGHPRVKAALEGFVDDWKGTQGEALNQALAEILKGE